MPESFSQPIQELGREKRDAKRSGATIGVSVLTAVTGVLAVMVLVGLFVAMAQFVDKKASVVNASNELESNIEQAISSIETFASRISVQLSRLYRELESMLLSWVEELNKVGADVLNGFNEVLKALVEQLFISILQFQTASQETSRRIDNYLQYVLKPRWKVEKYLVPMRSSVPIVIQVGSGITGILQRLYCVIEGVGNSMATFFTETIKKGFEDFWNNYLKDALFAPLEAILSAFAFVLSEVNKFIDGFPKLIADALFSLLNLAAGGLAAFFNKLKDAYNAVLRAIAEAAQAALDALEDAADDFKDFFGL